MGLKSYFTPQKLQHKSNNGDAEDVQATKSDGPPAPPPGYNTPSNITPWPSRPGSVAGDTEFNDTRCEIMVSWLHQQQVEKTWSDNHAKDEGVVLKKTKGDYACCPESLYDEPKGFRKAVEMLNVRVSPCHIAGRLGNRKCADCQ